MDNTSREPKIGEPLATLAIIHTEAGIANTSSNSIPPLLLQTNPVNLNIWKTGIAGFPASASFPATVSITTRNHTN